MPHLSLPFVQGLPLSKVSSQAILTHKHSVARLAYSFTCLAALLSQILVNSQIGEF